MSNPDDIKQTVNNDMFWSAADEWFIAAIERLFNGEYNDAIAFPFYKECTTKAELWEMMKRIGMHCMVNRCLERNKSLRELGDENTHVLDVSVDLQQMPIPPMQYVEEDDDWDEEDDEDYDWDEVNARR